MNSTQYIPSITQTAHVIHGEDSGLAQRSLFDSIDNRFEAEATRRERATVATLINQQSIYPSAPPVIRRGWEALVPAIIELSYHQTHDALTLPQSIRKTRNLNGTGSRVTNQSTFKLEQKVLDQWVLDVLIPLGTMPIEKSDATERFVDAGADRLAVQCDDDGGISAQGRSEALMCLELLCAKAWYARNVEKRSEIQTKVGIFAALQFMYWECGIPSSLSMLWDDPPELTDRIYDEVRRFNFRQLYAVQEANLLPNLITRINEGIEALKERREHFNARFKLALRRDPRWKRNFAQHSEVIGSKYAISVEEIHLASEAELFKAQLEKGNPFAVPFHPIPAFSPIQSADSGEAFIVRSVPNESISDSRADNRAVASVMVSK